ncbi:MAG: sulfite exporter TauE/SafE family protein [Pseudomonadota bacterium]
MSPTQIVVLTLVMLVTGAVGAITGGNSLVNVPLMIVVGMSPRAAVATNMFAVFFMTVSSTVRFARHGLIAYRLALPLCVLTIVSSTLGAELAVKLPEAVVKTIVGVSMGLLVAFMAVKPGSTARSVSIPPPAALLGFMFAFLLGIYGGLFSGGYTTLMTFLGVTCFGLRMLESVAITKPINLVSCAAASLIFYLAHLIDFRVGIPLAVANFVGGYVGAQLAVKSSERLVRALFLATVACLALKLLAYDVLYRALVAAR